MHNSYTEIDLDKSIKVKFKALYKNALILDFKFYDSNQNEVNVTTMSFKFVIMDVGKTVEFLVIQDNEFERIGINEIKHVINSLTLIPDTYKVDFTTTYSDGKVQTFMDGDFIIRERYIL
jgi:hypothetical protein